MYRLKANDLVKIVNVLKIVIYKHNEMAKIYKIYLVFLFFVIISLNYIADIIFWQKLDLSIKLFFRYAIMSFVVVVIFYFLFKHHLKHK